MPSARRWPGAPCRAGAGRLGATGPEVWQRGPPGRCFWTPRRRDHRDHSRESSQSLSRQEVPWLASARRGHRGRPPGPPESASGLEASAPLRAGSAWTFGTPDVASTQVPGESGCRVFTAGCREDRPAAGWCRHRRLSRCRWADLLRLTWAAFWSVALHVCANAGFHR